jgi:hypothetical protein
MQYILALQTLLLLLFFVNVLRSVVVALTSGHRDIPGPVLARFTDLWRLYFVSDGRAHENYGELHQKYGPIVRMAPKVVDISEPSVIPIIYGAGSAYSKVGEPE